MERYVALPGNHSSRTNVVEKPMEACAWCMQPASAVAAPVPCVSCVNGRAQLPKSRAFVSVLLHPLVVGVSPLLWKDWSRRQHRRACMQLLRRQRVDVTLPQALQLPPAPSPPLLSRAQRAHYRLSWQERLARNARAPTAGRITIQLCGVPDAFSAFLGLPTQL